MKTKKLKSAARFRAGFGVSAKKKITSIEEKQRKKQTCPFCRRKGIKRMSKGIWKCKKCGKKFASHAYYLE